MNSAPSQIEFRCRRILLKNTSKYQSLIQRVNNDNNMYKSIMNGMAAACQIPTNNTAKAIKVNRSLLFPQVKFVNLSANNSRGHTSKYEKIMVIATRKRSQERNASNGDFRNTNDVMNKAFAEVGTPMNESFWFSSILNLANRSAEKIARDNAMNGR